MPTPIRNPFAPPPPPQPKPRKLKPKREEPIPKLSAEEVYDLQLAMYERANALVAAFLVYYDSVFNKEAEFLPTGHTVVKLIQAQKDNIVRPVFNSILSFLWLTSTFIVRVP